MCFKRLKCDFNMEKIPILGVIVSKEQIQMEQEKIKAVKEWKMLTKVKDVESFLGFANFYQRFIQNFSHTAKPLNKLKGKKEWKWEEEHQKVFKELKEKITSQTVGITQERRKIQDRNGCFRTCHWRSTFPRVRRKVETHNIFIKDDAASRTKLQNLQQGTTSNSGSFGQIETISTRCCKDIRNLDGP